MIVRNIPMIRKELGSLYLFLVGSKGIWFGSGRISQRLKILSKLSVEVGCDDRLMMDGSINPKRRLSTDETPNKVSKGSNFTDRPN